MKPPNIVSVKVHINSFVIPTQNSKLASSSLSNTKALASQHCTAALTKPLLWATALMDSVRILSRRSVNMQNIRRIQHFSFSDRQKWSRDLVDQAATHCCQLQPSGQLLPVPLNESHGPCSYNSTHFTIHIHLRCIHSCILQSIHTGLYCIRTRILQSIQTGLSCIHTRILQRPSDLHFNKRLCNSTLFYDKFLFFIL